VTRIDDYHARWLEALREHESGRAELPEGVRADYLADWDAAGVRLDELIANRLERLDRIESSAGAALASAADADRLLRERGEYLDLVSFWLREDSPVGADSLAGARREIPWLVETMPDHLVRPLRTFRARGFGAAQVAAVLLALLVVPAVLVRRRIRAAAHRGIEQEGADPLRSFLWSLARILLRAAPPALFGAAVLLFFRPAPFADPTVAAALCLLAILAAYLLLTGTTDALLRYYAVSAQATDGDPAAAGARARLIFRVGLIGVAVLLPLRVFADRAGADDLAGVIGLAGFFWGWAMAAWLVFRRDVLSFYVPTGDAGRLSTSLRKLLRRGWPFLVAFLLLVGVLDLLGYRTAARSLGSRSLLLVAVLAVANSVYQLLHAVIGSMTRADEQERGPESEAAELRGLLRQLFRASLLVAILIGAWIGVTWSLGIAPSRWRAWGAAEIVASREGHPGTTVANVVTAIAVLALTIFGASWLRRLLQLALTRVKMFREGTRYTLSTLLFYTIVTAGILMSFRGLGVYLSELTWFLAPFGVAVGFGLTQIFSNFVSGLILFFERPVQVGDIISVGTIQGDVKRINIRSTVVRTRDGISYILPNRKLIEEDVVNWSHMEARTRMHVGVGVAYGSNLEVVREVLRRVAEEHPRVLRFPRPEVDFLGFDDSALSFELLVWLSTPDSTVHRQVRTELNLAIDAAFRRDGVTIPFPQRDLHLKSVPKDAPRDPAALAEPPEDGEPESGS